jgi:hypothetical protein
MSMANRALGVVMTPHEDSNFMAKSASTHTRDEDPGRSATVVHPVEVAVKCNEPGYIQEPNRIEADLPTPAPPLFSPLHHPVTRLGTVECQSMNIQDSVLLSHPPSLALTFQGSYRPVAM